MHAFVIEQLLSLARPGAQVLDFGCGDGELVSAGRSAGLDICGADSFFGGTSARPDGIHTLAMPRERLPFPNNSFDLVCANQVFEHVDDLELALNEIDRVLKPGGVFLNIFPSIGVIREGHCGVPMAHWLQRWPRMQRRYLHMARFAGFGYFKDSRTRRQWAIHMGEYLQRFTVYRPEQLLMREHRRRFPTLQRAEVSFAAFRLRSTPWLADMVQWWCLRPLTRAAICSLGSMVIIARKAS